MDKIYIQKLKKYPLTDEEINNINKTWEFIKLFFDNSLLFLNDYREEIINKINEKYNQEEFYFYEQIANKLFWNLRENLLKRLSLENNFMITKEKDFNSIKNKLGNYYRSFINKLIIIDEIKDCIYYKEMEGSSHIFNKNELNLINFLIFSDRNIYEKYMTNPDDFKIENIKLPEFYYQFDYPFPNLNTFAYEFCDKNKKLERIKKMYFNGNANYWFKLIK